MTLLNRIPILQIPHSPNGQVAQLVERGPEKAGVGGSIPSLATILFNEPKAGNPRFKVRRTNPIFLAYPAVVSPPSNVNTSPVT